MDNLVSFDMKPDGYERYRVKNLKINHNLNFFQHSLKHNGKKYFIRFYFGDIVIYRVGWFGYKKLLISFEDSYIYSEGSFKLVQELLNLSKDEMQRYTNREKEYSDKVKNWENQTDIKSFSI